MPLSSEYLDAFSQPALVLEQGCICAVNEAARRQLGDLSSLTAALTPALEAAAEDLLVCDRRWRLRVVSQDGQTLVVFHEVGHLSTDELGVISRTLRQPINDLFVNNHTLFEFLENLEDPNIQTLTARLNQSQYRLLRIANCLTAAGDYLSQSARLHLGRVDLKSFMEKLEEQLSGLVEAAGLHLQVVAPDRFTSTYLDENKIRQALLYLVSNAMKYAHPGSVLQLEVQADLTHVTFRCVNQGEPMDPTVMNCLEDLTQLQGGVGDPRWGLGLGLRLAWSIARLHGGTLFAKTTPAGETQLLLRLDRIRRPIEGGLLRSPTFDLTGGYNSLLIELSDVLPAEVFDTVDVH